MRNLLAFVATLVVTVAGVGLYLDWYKVRTASPATGRRTVNIDINTDKIGVDLREGGEYILEQGGEKIQEILDKHRKDESPQQAEGGKGLTTPDTLALPQRRKTQTEPETRGSRTATTTDRIWRD